MNEQLIASVIGGSSPVCYNTSPGTLTARGAGGTGSYNFLWYKDGNSTGVTTSTYNPGQLTAATQIYCRVTSGSCGTVNSNTVAITVYDNLTASVTGGLSPICYNVSPGTLTVTPGGGTLSYTYLWYKNGISTGITTATYNPGALTATSEIYCAVTSGTCGTVNSGTKEVVVIPPLRITSQPADAMIRLNQDAGFSLIATGQNLHYQWQYSRDGSDPWTNTGSDLPNITIQNVNTTETDLYRCYVSSDCGSEYSDIVGINILVDYLQGAEIPEPLNRQTDTTKTVGSTVISPSVSQAGAATITIPIFSAPGTNGMAPSITLSYNSHSEGGIAGAGWNMSGLSSITRTIKPFYVNGKIGAINLDAYDSYAIDGNYLVLTGDNPGSFDGDEYRTEIETFREITSWGTSGEGPAWFDVRMKNGIIAEYGNAPYSVIKSGDNTLLSWNISKIMDPSGNYCEYVYQKDFVSDQTFLKEIRYTGNDNASPEPYNILRFFYERKADENEYFFQGLAAPQRLILTRIESISEGDVLRTYDLRYTNGLYSHLVELTETGTGGDGYNSTIFGWGSISSLYQTKDIESAFNADSSYILTGDFNGDGLADLFTYPRKTGPYSSEDKWRIYSGGQSEYEFLAQGDLTSDFKGFIITDGDGDGDDDFYQEIQNQSVSVSFLFYKLAADSLLRDANYDFTRALDGFMDINMLPADFNGDGFDDIMFVYANNNIEGFENIDVQSTPLLNAPDRILMLDFNGDGKTDIATIKYDPQGLADTLNVIGLNSNTGNFESYLQDFISDGLDNISTGDFNGDRKTDFLLRNDNNDYVTTKILFSTGSGIIEKNCPVTANLTTGVYQDSTVTKSLDLIVNDFNLDGKADIMKSLTSTTRTMGTPVNGSSSVFQEIYLSYGAGFAVETVYTGEGSRVFGQADCDGDGNQDFILTINGKGNTAIEYLTDYQRDLLTSVTDGKNTRVEFTYKSLMDTSVYNREPEEYDTPVFSMAYPVKLLSGIKTYNNNNQALIEESVFSYTNLKHHRQGKGNLGFSKITAENLTNGSKTVSSCSYDTLYFVPYTSGIEKYMNNNPVSEATNVFSYKTFDGGTRFLPYSSQSTNTDLLNNVSTGNTVILDDEGNLTRQETEYLDGSQTVVKETVSEFSGYNSFGKPTAISVTNTRNGVSVTRSKTVAYDQITGLPLSETAAFGSSPSVVTTYSYDDFGNQESLSVTSGSKTRTGENIWEQGKGRFMTGKVNALGDSVSYSYNNSGSVISSTDISGLVTSFTYDGLGNIETTTLPGDRVIQSSTVWSQNSTGKGDLYYRRMESTGKPTTVEYFDISGRSIRSKIQGFDGTYLVTETEFDSLGRTIRSYNPCFEGSAATRYTGYQYDDYNRIVTETIYPNNAITT